MKTKYIWLLAVLLGVTACENDDDSTTSTTQTLPPLTAGSVNFSNYVALGNSLTAGITDGALFIAGQENSYPNLLSQQFALAGGGNFTQPWMSDNTGGLLLGATQIANNRLVTTGGAPLPLDAVIGPVTPTTNLATNNPIGPFNNMGVPSAKAIHLLAPGYGDLNGLFVSPATANPFFVRMASSPTTSILADAMAQNPSFFSLWIGANDVLGYALTGGDGTNPITDQPTFNFAYSTLITTLTSGGAQGVVANIPYVTDIPHFTTVTHNVIPLDAATAGFLNSGSAYGAYNAGIQGAFAWLVANAGFPQEDADAEIAKRTISFAEAADNAVVIMDESLTDLTGLNPALISMRQATSEDLFVLTSISFIGTEAVPGNPATVNGVGIPLADKWVLLPSEQEEIKTAIDTFNPIIVAAASSAGLAFFDANAVFQELASTGYASNDFILTSNLVTGGAVSLDGIHPTARGYVLAANEFMKAIDATYGSNFEASGNLLDVGDYPTNYSPLLP